MISPDRRTVRQFRKQLMLKNPLPSLWMGYQDYRANRKYATAEKRILVVRHAYKNPRVYDFLLDWLAQEFPDIRTVFELRQISYRTSDWSRYCLLIPWLPDPVQQWSLQAYHQTQQLTALCDERGIPSINRVDRLLNATKAEGARRIGSVGIRVPKMAEIHDEREFKETLLGLHLPLFVRENWGHGGNICRADTMEQIQKIDIKSFSRPVAVEFIETQNPVDGLYRKYRYIAAGAEGVTASLHVRRTWMVHGSKCEFSEAIREEEVAFINNPDPNHKVLQEARKALDLDFVAFDYSYDPTGRLVVWEGNPYPKIHWSEGRKKYKRPAIQRTLAAMVKMYLQKASLSVPPKINEILRYS